VREETSGARALESVRALARHHRLQSSPGYDEAARWVAAELAAFGFEPEWEPVPGDGRTRALGILMPRGWECGRAMATLAGASGVTPLCDYAAAPLSIVQRSAPVRGTFPLIAVAGGARDSDFEGLDVRGRVVLTDAPVHAVHERAVLARGAAGLLSYGRRLVPPVRGDDDDADALPYTSFWWADGMPRGWGFVVSPAEGRRLRARLDAGEPLALRAEIESREFETTIPLLSAAIPGGSDEEILLVAHLCHPLPSANDNASGAAALLETARVLKALADAGRWTPGRRGVRFLWMPELTGTCAWLALDRDRARRIPAALNLDMVGEDQSQCGSTLLIEHPPCFLGSFAEPLLAAIRHAAQDWVESFSGPGHFSMTRMSEVPWSGGSDHAVFVDPLVGVPCPMLIQWPDRFYHASSDTPDKCDPASLALAVRCAATYAGTLSALNAPDAAALLTHIARDARRRYLQLPFAGGAEARAGRERVRGIAAMKSLARLGLDPGAIAAAIERFDAFCEKEGPPVREVGTARGVDEKAPRPRRSAAGPLEFLPHLWPGWIRLERERRERIAGILDRLPGGRATLDVAWLACDGERTLAEIGRLVALETGVVVQAGAAGPGAAVPGWHDVFEGLADAGLVHWGPAGEAAWALRSDETPAR
jgi:hypothetical protein